MIGLILIAISWVLLRIEKKPLSVLGFNKPLQRFNELWIAILVVAIFAALRYLVLANHIGFSWVVNPDLTLDFSLKTLAFIVNSVLFEELLFRGYLLYKAIGFLGPYKGCFLSAIAFGVYHWFSYGIFGDAFSMVYVFLLTSTFGYMLAYAFHKSQSIFLPIGLHFGWNIVAILIFSDGPMGKQLLISDPISNPSVLDTYFAVFLNFSYQIAVPLFILWLMAYKVSRYKAH